MHFLSYAGPSAEPDHLLARCDPFFSKWQSFLVSPPLGTAWTGSTVAGGRNWAHSPSSFKALREEASELYPVVSSLQGSDSLNMPLQIREQTFGGCWSPSLLRWEWAWVLGGGAVVQSGPCQQEYTEEHSSASRGF